MRKVTLVSLDEWDGLVSSTYNRPYNFQQQDGCKSRGVEKFSVPHKYADDFEATEIPEIVNGQEMGVCFKSWLERDPGQYLSTQPGSDLSRRLWWYRNFYPDFGTVVNDLHARGLLEPGEYIIDIDW